MFSLRNCYSANVTKYVRISQMVKLVWHYQKKQHGIEIHGNLSEIIIDGF